MLTFEAVTEARLDRVTAAAEAWGALRNRYLGLHDQLVQQVVNRMAAGWEGSAATQAKARVGKAADQLNAAAEEAADLAKLLNDAAGEFRDAQNRLRQLVEEEAPAEQLRITSSGEVVDVHPEPDGAQQPGGFLGGLMPARQQAVLLMTAKINAVLAQATQADQATAWALAQDPNGARDHGFNADGFNDLDQARAAERDLAEALDLARKGGSLSPVELARLNALLEARKGDQAFAEAFATGLGARGTMEFWRSVNDPAQYGDPFAGALGVQPPGRAETMAKLQASLGETLGTASQSHSQAMGDWKKEMIGLGPEPMAGGGRAPYGFQLMGSLMRTGEYDSGFLNEFGSALVDTERSAGKGATLAYGWDFGGGANWDHLAERPVTADPMAAFAVALGNNPDAATAFLDPGPGGTNDHLNYLLKDRQWPLDGDRGMFHATAGPLGPALEAAATGDPAGQADGDRRHNDAQARVAQATLVALDPKPGEEELPGGLEGPIANVLADYVDDTHAAFGGVDDKQPGGATNGSVYTTPDGSSHIAVNQGTLIRVMRGAAEDPDAYAVMHTAETRKVSEVLQDIPPGASETQQRDQIQQSAAALSVYDAIRDDIRYDKRDDDNGDVEWNAKVVQSVVAVADIPAGPAKNVIDPLTDTWLTSVVNDSKEATNNKALADVGRHDLEAKGQLKLQIGEWAKQRGDNEDGSHVNVLQREAENTRGTSYNSAIEALRGHS
ncbi:hypothetical protein ACFYS8_04650 [Kitasatospora sp. NPDC004615]|uniref:hypothetical protein n=1 Tax=Kitasatospora sp. NPDC004615 TaxID=3364017 RepID=UPI0036A30A9F